MYIRKHPAPPIGLFLRGADLPPFVTERWRQKCPQSTSVGIGRRCSLSGHKRLRCCGAKDCTASTVAARQSPQAASALACCPSFSRPLRALEPPSDLIPPPVQCGDSCALCAMIIIRLRPHMAGLRPAGSHCENSGSSDGSGASARSGRAKQRSLLCPLSERGCRHPLLFAVLDLLVLLDQAKSTRKDSVRRKLFERSFAMRKLLCASRNDDYLLVSCF